MQVGLPGRGNRHRGRETEEIAAGQAVRKPQHRHDHTGCNIRVIFFSAFINHAIQYFPSRLVRKTMRE